MKEYFRSHMRLHKVFLVLLLLLLYPATGFSLDNDFKNTDLGFQFYPPGARALGMGGAFVGLADDATAAASNPAGLAQLTRMQLAIEGRYSARDDKHKSFTSSTFNGTEFFQTSDSEVDDTTDVSFGAFTTPLFNNMFVASVFYDKPMSFSSDKFAARGLVGEPASLFYPSSTDISIDEVGVSIAKGFADGRIMLGVGAGAQFFDFDQHETWIQNTRVEWDSDETEVGASFRAGILVKPIENLRVGASYTKMPQFDHDINAVDLDTGVELEFDTKFDVPDNISIGAAYNIFPNWVMIFEARYIMYSQLEKGFQITQQYPDRPLVDTDADGIGDSLLNSSADDYTIDNVMEIHFGTEYVLGVIPNIPIALRAGIFYEPSHDLKFTRRDGVEDLSGRDPDDINGIERNLFDGGDDLMHYTFGTGTVLFNHLQIDVGADITEESRNVALSMVYQF